MNSEEEMKNVIKCKTCKKVYSTISNLNRHLLSCEKQIKFKCDYCKMEFSQKDNLKRHIQSCKLYEYEQLFSKEKTKYEEIINQLTADNKELKKEVSILKEDKDNLLTKIFEQNSNSKQKNIINNTTNNFNIIGITTEDLKTNDLKINDIMDYGNSIANYVLNSTNCSNKVKLKDRARKLIEYGIDNVKYDDKGRRLIIFIISTYKDKIIDLLKKTYNNELDTMSEYNEHLKRLKNIRDNEMNEIIIEEKTDNKLSIEIFNTLIENLNRNTEIKYIVE